MKPIICITTACILLFTACSKPIIRPAKGKIVSAIDSITPIVNKRFTLNMRKAKLSGYNMENIDFTTDQNGDFSVPIRLGYQMILIALPENNQMFVSTDTNQDFGIIYIPE